MIRTLSHFSLLVAILSGLLLTACDDKKGPPILGDREAIFVGDDPLIADPSLKNTKVTLPQARVNKSWPCAGGSVDHSFDPVALGSNLKKVWSESIGTGSGASERLLNGPVAADGRLFTVDTRGYVSAFDIQTGKQLWSKDSTPENLSTQAFSGGLAYENGFVFIVTPAAEIVMMKAEDGSIEKRFSLTAPVRAAPTVKNGYIYAVNINNQLEAINYRTGDPAWSHSGIMEIAGLLGGASPALTPDLLIVPYTSGEVYALHPGNGLPLWSESLVSLTKLDPISSLFHIKARPAVKGNHVYLIGNGGVMSCLDANSGKTLWTHTVGGIRSPAVSGDYLFMATNNNELACFNRFSGKVVWVKQLPRYLDPTEKSDPILWAGPILVDKSLALSGSTGTALILSVENGDIVQELDLGDRTLLSPIAVENTLVFLTDNGELLAYRGGS
ncbi:MAG: PQQ-binding-like beta-propeller repeat protein [Alphaproteobacteria bacterium]|nr:PQQ-binding-like beta-propeller repeat protein [Alphaproteobacteria bacterium]NCQ67096.1 PQQ-binding-like beta-propeller repeat protein [Alphaproteobacteria bacterium]NCT07693.1 PQQ-binding-like beta-propeller repeat protein [Alphaproteobacteria bacterium]